MKTSIPTILSIAPGRKTFGIAVFAGAELTHFSIRRLPNENTGSLVKKLLPMLVGELILGFNPQIMAVRSRSQYQKVSTILGPVTKIIKQEAIVRGVKYAEVSLTEVIKAFCNDRQATQKKAFEILIALFPELRQFADRPNKWQTDYYHNLLSAVAVGVVVLRSLNKSN